MITRSWDRNWAVFTAIVVHFGWSLILLFSHAPLDTTPLAEFPVDNRYVAAACYFVASALAAYPFIVTRHDTTLVGLVLTLPQQWLLMISAWTGLLCGLRGQYPDGYVPAGGAAFIWSDQLWAICGMFFHTFSVIDWYVFSRARHCGECGASNRRIRRCATCGATLL